MRKSDSSDYGNSIASIGRLLLPFLWIVLLSETLLAQVQDAGSAVDVGVAYTAEFWGNVGGGMDRGVRYMDNIDVTAEVDLEQAAGWTGGSFFFYGLGNQGGSIGELAGDFQGISNIEAETSWRIYEVWAEQLFPEAGISLLGGLYDVNSEFNVLPSAQLFINSSHGIGAAMGNSGVLGPSIFPYTSLGARLKARLARGFYLQAAAVDGVPSNPGSTGGTKIIIRREEGLLIVGEISLANGSGEHDEEGGAIGRNSGNVSPWKIAVGAWWYTEQRERFSPPFGMERDEGFYIIAETELLTGLSIFGRLEVAHARVNRVHAYTGGGIVVNGVFQDAGKDRMGLALARANRSDYYAVYEPVQGMLTDRDVESNVEFTYQLSVGELTTVQFDTQYILNPGWRSDPGHAWVCGLRLGFSL